jgi:hypothetical protein
MLGIPAALHSDADVETEYAEDGSPAHVSVEGGELQGDAGLVHFPLPLRRSEEAGTILGRLGLGGAFWRP